MTPSCPRERDVVAAIVGRRWEEADAGAEELRAHAAACASCSEVAMLADIFREDVEGASRAVRVPAAGQVWWRAAVRARLEATRGASRPITWLQGVAGAGALGFVVALLGLAWPTLRAAATRIGTFALGLDPAAPNVPPLLAETIQRGLPILLVLAVCVVLAPVALYFALSDD